MLLTQIALILLIGSLGFWRPSDAMIAIVLISIGMAVFSATQDIVLDAYRREILHTDGELALGNSVHVQAYRVAGLVPGTLGMILAGSIGWDLNFMIMAAFMSVGVGLALLIGEPHSSNSPPQSLWQATVIPFQEFFQRRALGPALAVLAFMVFYKLGDNMATALATLLSRYGLQSGNHWAGRERSVSLGGYCRQRDWGLCGRRHRYQSIAVDIRRGANGHYFRLCLAFSCRQ